jgi:diguanylate cyclase (GGDEF)-like protein
MDIGEVMIGRGTKRTLNYGQDDGDAYRLRRSISPDVMHLELVSAFAGDRDMTEAERAFIRVQKDDKGSAFFSDLLYIVSHQYFPPEIAEALWDKILLHKLMMSERLGRNVRITVATLDYLSNIMSELRSPTVISETSVSEMTNLSMRDGMTGLFNHSSCYELLELKFRIDRRHGAGLSLLLLDIDDFKSVNDRYGHQEGDRILINLAKTIKEQVRESDICCRFGGDEFVVILSFTNDPDEACKIAENIKTKAASIRCGEKWISISVGVAVCDHTTVSPQALIESADCALYKAKRSGKNEVIVGVTR